MLLPDVERMVSAALRADAGLTALVDQRIYTELPRQQSDRVFPLVRLGRIGGGPAGTPLYLDAALLQLDVWGGTKFATRTASAELVRALDELAGYSDPDGYITGTSPGAIRYIPDETFTPQRPRYVVDVVVYARPTP